MQSIDTQAYVVAVNRRRIGVAVTAGQGFRLMAADPEFRPLDGSSFRHLAQLEQAAARLARAVGPAREGGAQANRRPGAPISPRARPGHSNGQIDERESQAVVRPARP